MSPRQLIISLFVFSFTSISVAQVQWTEVITDNQPLPGITGNYDIYEVILGEGGDIGLMTGAPQIPSEPWAGTTYDFWVLHQGMLQSVARNDLNNTDPVAGGFFVDDSDNFVLDDIFTGFIGGSAASPSYIVFPSGQSSGITQDYDDMFYNFALSGNGLVALRTPTGVFAGNPMQPLLQISGSGPAPGTTQNFSPYYNLDQNSGFAPLINNAGQVAFLCKITSYNGPTGVWFGSSNTNLQLILLGGQPFGITNQLIYPQNPQVISDDGKLLIPAQLKTTSATENAEMLYENGSLSQISPTGQSAPGVPNAIFSQVAWSIMDHTGHITTRAMITGPDITSANNIGIWIGNPGSQQLALQTGSPAPGTPDVFSDLLPYHTNALGQILFVGVLTGPDVGQYNEFGYWLWSPGGQDQLILRAGEPIDLGNDLTAPAIMQDSQEVIASESWTNFDDPAIFVPDLDDQGQILWSFNANGTPGVFETLPIPEPASIAAFIAFAVLFPRIRRGSYNHA